MSDNEEKQNTDTEPQPVRPNANYRLSNEHPGREEITYYYNRERRLEKAPQAVRDLYREQKPRRFGLFRSLTDSKPRALTFISIVVMSMAIMVLSILGYIGNTWELDGNRFSIQAVKYEGMVIIALKKENKQSILRLGTTAYTGAVNIAVSPVMEPGELPAPEDIFYHRIFFTLEDFEDYRFVVPFDDDELLMVLQTERKTRSIKIKPE